MGIKAIIEHKLDTLSETGDDKLFEQVGNICIQEIIKQQKIVFPHSGNPYGGDGGVDGFILNMEFKNPRIAYSTSKDWKRKLNHDAGHENAKNYDGMIFCSSREINQREIEKAEIEFSHSFGYPIRIIVKSQLVRLIENLSDCLNLLGIPTELNKLEIQYLAKHNQFGERRDMLSRYVQRRIVKKRDVSDTSSSESSILLSEYIKNPADVSVMISPAGYGKTGALEQVCNYILSNAEIYTIPPVYLPVSKYSSGSLHNMIDDIVGHSPDYELRDAILFIDGIDELPDEELRNLVNDLNSWKRNGSLKRKLFLAGRTNEFSSEALRPLGTISYVFLKKPSEDDIDQLIGSRIKKKEDRLSIKSYIIQNFYGANMFFIDKALLFFERKDKLPSAQWELLEFVATKDVCSILRTENPELKPIEQEAFNCIFRKTDYITINCKQINIDSFSHRYVIEYLAAKYLSSYPARPFLKIVTADKKYILPWIKNTVGLSLSLMANNREETKLNYLFSALSSEFFNLDTLIKCDSPNLDRNLKKRLIEKTTEFMLASYDVYGLDKDYCRLFFDPTIKDDNLNWLASRIDIEMDPSTQETLFHIIFNLSLNNRTDIPHSFVLYLKNKLFNFINREDNSTFYGLISTILYCLAILSEKGLFSKDEISILIDFLNTRYWKHECFNNTCRIITKCCIVPSLSDFCKLVEIYLRICDFTEKNTIAQYVPDQIDDEFDLPSIELQYTDDFHPLALNVFKANPNCFWMTMRQVINACNDNPRERDYNEDEKILTTLSKALIEIPDLRCLEKEKLDLVLDVFMINPYSKNSFRNAIMEKTTELVAQLFSMILDEWESSDQRIEYHSVFRDFILEMTKNKNLFLYVVTKQKLSQEDFENRIGILSYFSSKDDESFSCLTESNQKRAFDNLTASHDYENNRKRHEDMIASSIHQIFDIDKNIFEISRVFNSIGKDVLAFDDISRVDIDAESGMHKNDLSPFSLFYLLEMVREDKESITEQKATEFWKEKTGWKTIIFLVKFMRLHNLSYTLLKPEELDFIRSWTAETLEKNPLRDGNDKLLYSHVFISILMNDQVMGNSLNSSIYPIKENIKGFISAGILRMLDAGYVDPQNATIDYLETYFSKGEIISHISENMDSILGNRHAMLGVGKYLSDNCSAETIPLYDYSAIKHKLVEYIRSNFSEPDYDIIIFDKFFNVNEITSDIFPVDLYLKSLKFDEKKNRYDNNLAAHFLKIHRERTDAEKAHINTVMKRRFKNSSSTDEKKYIAELLLNYDHSCHCTFNWYAQLLLKNDSTKINEFLTHNDFYFCNSIFAIRNLKKLFINYGSGTKDKSMAIRSIISNSATSIIKDSKHSTIAFAIVMRMLQDLHKKTNSDSILRLKLRCINEFTNRQEAHYSKNNTNKTAS